MLHFAITYYGFLGIKQETEERFNQINPNDLKESKKIPFLKGVILDMEASTEIGEIYATLAREMPVDEDVPERKADLLRIADLCNRLLANTAEFGSDQVNSGSYHSQNRTQNVGMYKQILEIYYIEKKNNTFSLK